MSDASKPDFRDLMAAVGETLLMWGFLESAIDKRLRELFPDAKSSNSLTVLLRWQVAVSLSDRRSEADVEDFQKDLREPVAVRNLLAHGLVSASADPDDARGPFVMCQPINGPKRLISLVEIEATKQAIHRLRVRVRDIRL